MLCNSEAQLCERNIYTTEERQKPLNLSGLASMVYLTTGSQLQRFICDVQRLCNSIPQIWEFDADLHEFVEAVKEHIWKRTRH